MGFSVPISYAGLRASGDRLQKQTMLKLKPTTLVHNTTLVHSCLLLMEHAAAHAV